MKCKRLNEVLELLQFMKENGGVSVKFTKEEGNFENFNTLDDLKKNGNLIEH